MGVDVCLGAAVSCWGTAETSVYIWERKKMADMSRCWMFWGRSRRPHAGVSMAPRTSSTRYGDLNTNCWRGKHSDRIQTNEGVACAGQRQG